MFIENVYVPVTESIFYTFNLQNIVKMTFLYFCFPLNLEKWYALLFFFSGRIRIQHKSV